MSISVLSRFCSVQRYNADKQRAELCEGRIFYPFHPRCGESVRIVERLYCWNLEIFVVRQPDGTSARLPAWMFEEAAACFALGVAHDFPLEVLRGLRKEIDVLLGCLQSDSRTQEPADANRRQARSARPVRRHRTTVNKPATGRGDRSASASSSDVRTDRERDEGTGG
jgi:hypothetical protein